MVRSFGLTKIPLIAFLWPQVIELSESRSEIKIPLTFRSKNHLGGMYFGALSIGADLGVGLLAIKQIKDSKKPVSLIFKDFNAKFLKRVEGHAHFICDEGDKVKALVNKAIETGERVEETISAYTTVPKLSQNEPVAQFELTLSLKLSSKHKN